MQTILRNGTLVLANEVREQASLVIDGQHIAAICSNKEAEQYTGNIVELDGRVVMPGMIDIHSDMIENFIQPRSTAIMDFEMGLREAERVIAECGITTMFHSISMYRDGTWDVKEIRQAPQVKRLAALVDRYQHGRRLIRHRYHLRYEIDNLACYDDVMQMMESGYVDLLSFMDHTPGQGQYKNLEIYRKHQPNEGKDLSDEAFEALVDREKAKEVVSFDGLKALADCAHAHGIAIASHDDDTVEKLAVNQALGVRISEFPITLEVAKAACAQGFMTVLGAPNILLGGSHSGNLSALDAIRAEAASVLVSDYYPQALLHAVFWLQREANLPLWQAVRYVTLNPATAVGMDDRIGSLAVGKLADLIVVDAKDSLPVLEQVYVGGRRILDYSYRDEDKEGSVSDDDHSVYQKSLQAVLSA